MYVDQKIYIPIPIPIPKRWFAMYALYLQTTPDN